MSDEKQRDEVKLFFNVFGDKDKYVGSFYYDKGKYPPFAMLEDVYSKSQNFSKSWSLDRFGEEYRSSSVGDYMELNGKRFYVARMGFSEKEVNSSGREVKKS